MINCSAIPKNIILHHFYGDIVLGYAAIDMRNRPKIEHPHDADATRLKMVLIIHKFINSRSIILALWGTSSPAAYFQNTIRDARPPAA